jgi:precorrin-2 dehydrogenase/sirohydrochlorin ferrochelatase
MVIAATNDAELNRQVSRDAQTKGLLINAVDQPRDCNFIFPSILKRGDLVLAISTSGKSPALARKIREQLEQQFGKEYEVLLAIMGHLRKEILARNLSQENNSRLFKGLIEGPLPEVVRERRWDEAAEIINRILNRGYTAQQVKEIGKGA